MSDINIGLLAENQNLAEFDITENFSCVRFLDQNKERFELESVSYTHLTLPTRS